MSLDIRQALSQFLNAIREDIIKEHLAQGQRASGRTLESFEVVVAGTKGQLWAADYVGVLETGRRPGKIPKDFPGIIQRWMNAKGIFQEDGKTQSRIAYLIARKISREGTRLHRAGGKSGVLSKVITESRIEAFMQTFGEDVMSETLSEILNEFQK